MPVKIDQEAFDKLAESLQPPPPPPKRKRKGKGWHPRLGPEQTRVFNSDARYILAHGEKGSGKTMGLLHKLVRHCYENQNALGLILVRVKAMATKGGAWDKLTTMILPTWRDGNRDKEGNLLDDGLGIQYSEVKFDAQHNEFIWVENRFGGWSMIVLISAPHAHQLRERIRGYEPSFVVVDELTSCATDDYFVAVSAQVGRRPGIEGLQQYTAACNPEGPSHWVYKKWFVEPYDEATDTWDPDFAKFHIPIAENRENLPDGYIENLEKIYRGDPVERARMMRGEWIDRPSGDAIFKDVWIPELAIKPHPKSEEVLLPLAGYPIVVGMDPGSANNAFPMLQYIPLETGEFGWMQFDEIVTIRKRIRYDVLVPILLRRLQYWTELVRDTETMEERYRRVTPYLERGETAPLLRVPIVYISDNSAFNQFRAASGSYDVLDIQKIADRWTPKLGLERMKVRQAPKFRGSVAARVRLMMDLLGQERFIVSPRCVHTIEMFNKLESEGVKPGKPFDPELALTPKRSDHLHVFDAITYPVLTQSIQPGLLAANADRGQTIMAMKT